MYSLLLLAAVSSFQGVSERLEAPAVYHRAKPCLVVVTTTDASGRQRFGSGVVIRPEGLIATNFHVVSGAVNARVKLANGDVYDDVAIAATDERKDIAILKIPAVNLSNLEFGDSETVQIGSTVFVLGAPLGMEGTLSQGLVSSIRQGSEISPELEGFRLIQFTAPVSPGSSGGPLLDETGRVMGLVMMGTLTAGQNLNFAVPSNYINGLVTGWRGEAQALGRMQAATPASPVRPPEEIIRTAKTLCVHVTSGSPVLKTEISKKLLKWNKLTLVSSPVNADLVLEVVQTGRLTGTGEGNQAAAVLRDTRSGVEVWTTTKGGSWAWSGWSAAWVGRAIADEFIKFYNSSTKEPKK